MQPNFSKDNLDNLINFRYKSGDYTISDKITNPLTVFLVRHAPLVKKTT